MRQALHILKKDVRRHWPEILISLILLGLYVRLTLQGPSDYSAIGSFPWYRFSAESIPALMVFSWIFLTLRVVHGEALVGDRQWWTSKPYEWWKLLLAKELFLLVFVSLPLFLVQLFFLHHAGFPIFSNFRGVLNLHLGLAIFLFVPSLALGSVTKNLEQALLGAAAVFLTISALVWLSQGVPSSSMSSAAEITGEAQGLLLFASIIGAAGWQYARRKTWASRGVLLAGIAALALIGALTPYARFVERKYPLVEGSDSPAKFTARVVPAHAKKRNDPIDSSSDVYLTIPLGISGVAPGKVVVLEGIKAVIETPSGTRLDPGWRAQWTDIWAEDEQKDVSYELKRDDYEKIKTATVQLHVELALKEYQETQAREITLPVGRFSEPDLGICQMSDKSFSQIDCRRTFRYPALMASFDPSGSNCRAEENEDQVPDDKVSHVWYPPTTDDGPEPGLNPVVEYPIRFGPKTWLLSSFQRSKRKQRVAFLCPGAKVRIAKPQATTYARVKVEIEAIHLEDLVASRFGLD
jgi:hypothetical protein